MDAIRAPFNCVLWIVVGAIAGAFARQLMRDTNAPFINDLILGILGAIVGGLLVNLLNLNIPEGGIGLILVNVLIATVGAAILIGIGRMMRGQRVA